MGKKTVKLDESRIKEMIKGAIMEAIMKEAPGMPMMVLTGRRESTNVEDRRGERFNFDGYKNAIANSMMKVWLIRAKMTQEQRTFARIALLKDPDVMECLSKIDIAYKQAAMVSGSFVKQIGAVFAPTPETRKTRSMKNLGDVAKTNLPVQINDGNNFTYEIKRVFVSTASSFELMVRGYLKIVKTGETDKKTAFHDIRYIYALIKDTIDCVIYGKQR